jgi:mannosyltransferase OCH1-like enzyme
MIPKVIHYCWFGRGEMPPLSKKCMETWEEHLKDYEFIKWDESNAPRNEFIDYHLEKGNWAFVSDYVRLYALHKYGGIYLDTDFEVLRSFDSLLASSGFVAYQDHDYLTNGIAGAQKGNLFYSDCMYYMDERFKKGLPYHISPIVTTEVLDKNKHQIELHPSDFFYPYNPYDDEKEIKILMHCMIEDNTFAIHHWAKSWDAEDRGESLWRDFVILMKKAFVRLRNYALGGRNES